MKQHKDRDAQFGIQGYVHNSACSRINFLNIWIHLHQAFFFFFNVFITVVLLIPKTFMLEYRYKTYEPSVKEKVVDMAINGSGIRDTSRVLGISKTTVIKTLKKKKKAWCK